MKDERKYCTSIGGQAVIEGVMMRGPEKYAIAVRKPDGDIVIEEKAGKSITKKNKLFGLPIIRGCISFFESMIIGTRALMFSADFFDIEGEEENEAEKTETWLERVLGDRLKDVVIGFSIFLSLVFSIGLFILAPTYITSFFGIEGNAAKTAVEGVLKILLFLGYLVAISRLKDIQRVFEYHGAEHKTIHCYEAGEDITVENVKKQSRLHPRCGTSFLLIVLVISIILFLFVPNGGNLAWYMRAAYKLLLLPLIAGVAYEAIKFAGRKTNALTRIISAPGMAFQYITTREPDDSQIEVAIASFNAVKPSDKEEAKW
ncbi:MAG: hypothetical protein BWY15_01882 [Firmicutes bacterium ADurb.Bin193]|nr:MAG: hypothetical protein BWY15_01882 [Firmicutes bacterium ADurb.Bin193]